MPTTARRTPTAVGVELGSKRVFACALDWPGWCRSDKTEELALEALAAYAPRYSVVAGQAGMELPAGVGERFKVVERVKGTGATDFGIPYEVVAADAAALPAKEAKRQSELVAGAWAVLDRVVAGAPAELRKGPRGGGRDRDKIVEVLRAPSDGSPPVPKGWPPRYAARRIAWHALDHAWEIEDRSEPGA